MNDGEFIESRWKACEDLGYWEFSFFSKREQLVQVDTIEARLRKTLTKQLRFSSLFSARHYNESQSEKKDLF